MMNNLFKTLAIAAIAAGLSLSTVPAASAQVAWDDPAVVDTQWGPLTQADRDLIAKVRLAGLWEGPTALEGMQRGTSRKVREVAAQLHSDHANLDEASFKAASQLNMTLPEKPSAEQAAWMAEIHAQPNGDAYDRAWVNRLRAAHGKFFLQINNARAGTRNDAVREFAVTANFFVEKHMSLLESTGLVDEGALPVPVLPTAKAAADPAAVAFEQRSLNESTANNLGVTILLSVALVGALAFGGIMILRRMART